jgi:large subunit ribosomal protein L1
MPNPKVGTVTFDVGKTVKEIKAGKVEFKVDKGGNVLIPVGKVSFDSQKLIDNTQAVIDSVNKAKPPTSKGKYLKKMTISSTMGPGIQIDLARLTAQLRK